jgi:outer membrane protein assembly factor BamB
MEFLMKLKLWLGTITILACLSGCAHRYYMPKDEYYTGSTWPFARKGIEATARIASDFKGNLNLKWERKVADNPIGPLSMGKGCLIFCGTRKRVNFFDLETGAYLGKYNGGRNIQTGLVVVDTLAYFGMGPSKNELVCLNLLNLDRMWSIGLKDATGPPIIIDKQLYIGSASGRIYCLDRLNGEVIWGDSVGARTPSGPSSNGEIVYFPFDNGIVQGYDAVTGRKIFSMDIEQPLMGKAVVADSTLFVAGSEGEIFALDSRNGRILWRKDLHSRIWASPALDESHLYVADNDGYLRAYDVNGGALRWEFRSGGVILSSPVVVGDFVIFASLDRGLYCLNRTSGEMASKKELKSPIQFPVISDGRSIYAVSRNGTLQCYGD